jgi:hypothetical protein
MALASSGTLAVLASNILMMTFFHMLYARDRMAACAPQPQALREAPCPPPPPPPQPAAAAPAAPASALCSGEPRQSGTLDRHSRDLVVGMSWNTSFHNTYAFVRSVREVRTCVRDLPAVVTVKCPCTVCATL